MIVLALANYHSYLYGSFQHLLFNMFALWMFGTAVSKFLVSENLLRFISVVLGAVALTFLVYFIQIYPVLSDLEARGFSYEIIKEISSLNILENNMFKGEILAQKMQPLLETYGKSLAQINTSTFRMF